MIQLGALADYLRELGGDDSDIETLYNLTLEVMTNVSLESITALPTDSGYKVTLNVGESHKITVIVRTDDELF